jgi:hypothetical protein
MPNRFVTYLTALLLIVISARPALTAANEGDFGETTLNINNDWVIYIDVERKKHLFVNPGSKLRPITNLRVSYRKTTRVSNEEEDLKPRVYEDLWYHDGRAMGSHRLHKLGIDRNKRGAIYVRTTNDASQEPRAVANAIVRLTLQTLVKDSILTNVIVPRDMFREVVTELGHFNFFKEVEGSTASGVQTSLYVTSNPPGMDVYMYYRKKR